MSIFMIVIVILSLALFQKYTPNAAKPTPLETQLTNQQSLPRPTPKISSAGVISDESETSFAIIDNSTQ